MLVEYHCVGILSEKNKNTYAYVFELPADTVTWECILLNLSFSWFSEQSGVEFTLFNEHYKV